jgi:hypothetical protein
MPQKDGPRQATTQPVTQATQLQEAPATDPAALNRNAETVINQPGFGEAPRRFEGVDPMTGAMWSIEVSPIGRPFHDEDDPERQRYQNYLVRTYDESGRKLSDEQVSLHADVAVADWITQPLGPAHPVGYKSLEFHEPFDRGPPREGGELTCEQPILVRQIDGQGGLAAPMHTEMLRQLVEVLPDQVGRKTDSERCAADQQRGPKWKGAPEAFPAQLRTEAGGVFRAIVTSIDKTEAVAKLENGEPERFFQEGTQAVLTFDRLENQMQLDVAVRTVDALTGEVYLRFVAGHLGLFGPAIPLGSDSEDVTPSPSAPLTADVAPK